MKKIAVNTSRKYEIHIDNGLIDKLGQELLSIHEPCSVMLVSDRTVARLYADRADNALCSAGFSVNRFIIEPGEASKSIKSLAELWETLADAEISRRDLIVALGGGVCGDLAGFAAATYMRGIEYIQVPTTLLAMVDSSVGGKTAIDLVHGKNLAGAFCQPSMVLCDPEVLSTLPGNILSDGMAEVIKYGFINRPELIATLESDFSVADVIAACVEAKRDIVEADEHDNSCRQLLNFGHTLAHGIEHCSDFSISHGSAVAIGMVLITRSAINAQLCSAEVLRRLVALLKKFNLPTETQFSPTQLCDAALKDKKRSGENITLVIPKELGICKLHSIPVSELNNFISAAWSDNEKRA